MTVTDQPKSNRESSSRSNPDSSIGTLRNGLVGGTVGAVLSVLPLSEVLGGAIAGYLDRGAGRGGPRAGAVAGLVAYLPYLLVATYLAVSPGIALPGPELALSREVVIAGAATVALVYVVGLSVVGGMLGGHLHDR